MQILLITNMLYSFVLPIVELFIGAYIMRNSSNTILVICFQLALYSGIPITFLVNGFLLRKIPITWLYSFGMLLSGVSMAVMMSLTTLDFSGIVLAGLIMGLSYGFFWANRDFLALSSTDDGNRNYYYGLESFFYTLAGVVVPYTVGVFIASFGSVEDINMAYRIITCIVFLITILASVVVFRGKFTNPESRRFLYWRFDRLWQKMMSLSALKGIAQGYIVTAPAMLVMTLAGNEDTLGTVQSIGAILSALMLYLLGRFSAPRHRLTIFSVGLLLFALGGAFNAALYSSTGVLLFMLCLVIGRPLMDLAYFPIQLRVIDVVAAREQRNSFTYIFIHELGLYLGRFVGCGMFLLFASYISPGFALRYALLVIGLAQLLSIPVARSIIRKLEVAEK
ncbi:MAG: MFS transporter [Alistipes sp.]|nr:MFS transporter [Alistipes sp.]